MCRRVAAERNGRGNIEETPRLTPVSTVTAPQPTIPEPEEVVLTATTEKEMAEVPEAEPVPETTSEKSNIPTPETEKQAEAEQESAPNTQPEPILLPSTQPEPVPTETSAAPGVQPTPEPAPVPDVSNDSAPEKFAEPPAVQTTIEPPSGDMVYVEGFGWIESQGPNHVEYADDMYENGNKIGIMG